MFLKDIYFGAFIYTCTCICIVMYVHMYSYVRMCVLSALTKDIKRLSPELACYTFSS